MAVSSALPANMGIEVDQAFGPSPPQTPATQEASLSVSDHRYSHPWRARLNLCAIYFTMFLAGWNDGSSGPLIPRMQTVYNVGFLLVSLTFVVACVGFISGALFNLNWGVKIGFGRMIVLGLYFTTCALCQVVAYSIQAPAPPFPLFILSFGINGFGNAVQNAQTNTYVASLGKNSELYMGMLHASYGAGALSSPLIATQFVSSSHWSFHYLVSLGLAILNITILATRFKFRNLEDCLRLVGEQPQEDASATSERSNFGQVLSLRAVHLLAFFTLVYVGVEVTIGGWITTYMIDVRGGGHSAGYVSSGFFAGLMIGRVALLWLNKALGEYYVLYLYTALIIGLELVVWLVPSLIGGAIAVALVGMFLGPVYPILMNRTARLVPRRLLSGSIGWIAGFGQAGSAMIPFITGAIASKAGIKALQPLIISLMACFPLLWALVPRSPRRID
ncbi:MFS domain-containing protein [Mycena indigotica]|uniref:MFS domain-containing protein n=1 Tax=Mycena indigotica TaxID=2126181 RepID=A0A8H6TEG8_9AGAR|nr:MFS domain-containing protein [Mycena indigotica]KAF7316208.1 MFS domain-containing protein [Mycena indigotica]